MNLKAISTALISCAFILQSCGGDTGGNGGYTQNNTSTLINPVVQAKYTVPNRYADNNILIDDNKIIFFGGQQGEPLGAQSDGHPAFSNKIYVIDLITGAESNYTISASSGHPFGTTVADGIGISARIKKLSTGKYIITGGFQYIQDFFVLDLNLGTVQKHTTPSYYVNPLNPPAPFYLNYVDLALFNDGSIGAFGYNSGLYGSNVVIRFDPLANPTISTSTAVLTMPRSQITTRQFADGKVLLVGGWDGTGSVSLGSATRRVEIYDPVLDTITQVSDYPEPLYTYPQSLPSYLATSDEVCVANKFKYTRSTDTWSAGCSGLQPITPTAPVTPSVWPNNWNPGVYGTGLVGRAYSLPNGSIAIIRYEQPSGATFSSSCNCKLYDPANTTVTILSDP